MTTNRMALVLSGVLFIVAGVLLLAKTAGDLVEPLALFGFAAWVLAGAL